VQRELPCLVDVGGEAVAAPGVVHLGLEVRAARGAPARGAPVGGELVGGESVGGGLTSGELLGGVRRAVYAAPGAHFLRLDFEAEDKAVQLGDLDAAARSDHPLADLPAASSPGEWRASSLRGSAAVGDGFLRLNDGGGSRFGRHYLLGPSALTYDTKQFPYLTFAVRLPPPAAVGVAATTKARAALNIKVDEHTVSLMLRGRFVRAWDRRRELPGAGHDPAATGWQRVRYDLDAALDAVLGPGNHRVSAIDVGDPRALCSNRFTGPDTADIDLDDFAVAR
jgi:hypothetical protein